ncbi:hypothetical protein C8J57DRAFT_1297149 [Mycena rebaudengoi]|nr:hypothetical protein C8J57DRAFT_1297149 [Mycena rebaudengoi]
MASRVAVASISDYANIFVTRYVNGKILLYDHLLTLGDEVTFIWPAKSSSPKGLFLFIRYVVPCAMIVYTVQLSGLVPGLQLSTTVNSCRWWMGFAAFLGWGTVAIMNFLILLRLWVIWDRDRRLMVWTVLCFILAQVAGLVCASIVVWKMTESMVWHQELTMCGFNTFVPVAIIWLPAIAFECVVCGTAWWNALYRPRSQNVALTAALYHDGFLYFLVSVGLRVTNTVLATLSFLIRSPVWCATTTTACRLIIKMRRISAEPTHGVADQDIDATIVHGDYDELEQSGVHVEMLRSVGPSTPIRTASGWY